MWNYDPMLNKVKLSKTLLKILNFGANVNCFVPGQAAGFALNMAFPQNYGTVVIKVMMVKN